MKNNTIKRKVARAVARLSNERPVLEFHVVHERSTAHRLAVHLEPEFPRWNIDCEYDRFGLLQKILDGGYGGVIVRIVGSLGVLAALLRAKQSGHRGGRSDNRARTVTAHFESRGIEVTA